MPQEQDQGKQQIASGASVEVQEKLHVTGGEDAEDTSMQLSLSKDKMSQEEETAAKDIEEKKQVADGGDPGDTFSLFQDKISQKEETAAKETQEKKQVTGDDDVEDTAASLLQLQQAPRNLNKTSSTPQEDEDESKSVTTMGDSDSSTTSSSSSDSDDSDSDSESETKSNPPREETTKLNTSEKPTKEISDQTDKDQKIPTPEETIEIKKTPLPIIQDESSDNADNEDDSKINNDDESTPLPSVQEDVAENIDPSDQTIIDATAPNNDDGVTLNPSFQENPEEIIDETSDIIVDDQTTQSKKTKSNKPQISDRHEPGYQGVVVNDAMGGEAYLNWNVLSFQMLLNEDYWFNKSIISTFIHMVKWRLDKLGTEKAFDTDEYEFGHVHEFKMMDDDDWKQRFKRFKKTKRLCRIMITGGDYVNSHYQVLVLEREEKKATLIDWSQLDIDGDQKFEIIDCLETMNWRLAKNKTPLYEFKEGKKSRNNWTYKHLKYYNDSVTDCGAPACGPFTCLVYQKCMESKQENFDFEKLDQDIKENVNDIRWAFIKKFREILPLFIKEKIEEAIPIWVNAQHENPELFVANVEKQIEFSQGLLALSDTKFEAAIKPQNADFCVCGKKGHKEKYCFNPSCCYRTYHPECYMDFLWNQLSSQGGYILCPYCDGGKNFVMGISQVEIMSVDYIIKPNMNVKKFYKLLQPYAICNDIKDYFDEESSVASIVSLDDNESIHFNVETFTAIKQSSERLSKDDITLLNEKNKTDGKKEENKETEEVDDEDNKSVQFDMEAFQSLRKKFNEGNTKPNNAAEKQKDKQLRKEPKKKEKSKTKEKTKKNKKVETTNKKPKPAPDSTKEDKENNRKNEQSQNKKMQNPNKQLESMTDFKTRKKEKKQSESKSYKEIESNNDLYSHCICFY